MMYPRLFLAKNLLQQDGAIFISIDNNEIDNLIQVVKEVFGEENLLAVIANVNNPKGRSDDAYFATSHEYLIVAAKNINEVKIAGFEPDEKIIKRYNKLDGDRKYREIDLRKTGDNDLREDRPNLFYYFHYNEKTGEYYPTREENSPDGFISIKPTREDGREGNWRWGLDNAKENKDKLVPKFMPNRKTWGIMEKDFLDTRPLVKSTTSWTFKDVNSERGSEQFIELGFEKKVYPKPKPIGTLKRTIQLTHTDDEKYIALDFFAGSGSFGHAVYEFLCEKEKQIQYILVQLPELLNENKKEHKAAISLLKTLKKPLNYAEISKERLKRASAKYQKEYPDFKGDLGFKVLKLYDSNFKQWQQITGKDKQALEEQMKLFVDPVAKNATTENMVYELLLKSGKDLNSTIEAKDGFYAINETELVLVLEKANQEIIDSVIASKPQKVIALDKLFKGNDQLKTNTALQMKDAGIEFKTI